jgi:hypothetical protein
MYWIYPNMNRDTGEYWPVLKGHRFGVTDIEISIAFADHYKNVIKLNEIQTLTTNHQAKKMLIAVYVSLKKLKRSIYFNKKKSS